MKDYDAYLFDADGTIIDTRDMIIAAYTAMGETLGVAVDRDLIKNTIGLPVMRQLRELLGHGHGEDYYEKAREAYNDSLMESYDARLKAFPGVAEGLRELKALGKKMAVVTSRRRGSLEKFLDALAIGDYFELCVTPESTERHKPDPEPALFAAGKLGVAPERCVFIGDATFDIECGNAAGMDTVLVSWGGMDPSGWPVKPDLVVDEFSRLLPDKL